MKKENYTLLYYSYQVLMYLSMPYALKKKNQCHISMKINSTAEKYN